MTVRCLIVDDEPLAQQLLVSYVQQVKVLELVACCETAIEAFEVLHKEKIDLMFLDIQMPGINGLNFLRSLKSPPKVIFTTAYNEHAVEAFELEAIDYLLKPIMPDRFMKAIQKVISRKEDPAIINSGTQETAIFLKVNKRLLRIEYKDIIYIEGLGDYIKVITPEQTLISYMTLSKAENLLHSGHFIRIHKSYIININHITFIEGNFVKLGNHELPIGITYKETLLERINRERQW